MKHGIGIEEGTLAAVLGFFPTHAGDDPEPVAKQIGFSLDESGGDHLLEFLRAVDSIGFVGDGGRCGAEVIRVGAEGLI